MKKIILFGVIAIFLVASVGTVMAKGQGKDKDPGVWINYGNIKVDWLLGDSIVGEGSFTNERDDNYVWTYSFEAVIVDGEVQGEINFESDNGDVITGIIDDYEYKGDIGYWLLGTADWNEEEKLFLLGFNNWQSEPWRMILIRGTVNNREYQLYTRNQEITITEDNGYLYTWCPDRDLDGDYGEETLVEVNYGKYGELLEKYEGACVPFGHEIGALIFEDKVIHITETWVPGVSVPGGVSRFVVKDIDGDGEYTGGDNTVLFWPGLTKESGGPYLFQQKFDYHYFVDGTGTVTDGYYMQYQYFMIPGVGGAPSGGQ